MIHITTEDIDHHMPETAAPIVGQDTDVETLSRLIVKSKSFQAFVDEITGSIDESLHKGSSLKIQVAALSLAAMLVGFNLGMQEIKKELANGLGPSNPGMS